MEKSFNSMNEPVLSTFRKFPRIFLRFGKKPMLKGESNIPGAIKMTLQLDNLHFKKKIRVPRAIKIQTDITRPFQCNTITQHAYNLMYSIHHLACNVNNYFGLTRNEPPWKRKQPDTRRLQYPLNTLRSNIGIYKDNEHE